MSLSKNFLRAAILCWLSIGISSAAEREGHHRDEKPKFPYDPNTTKYCSWWVDNDGSVPCSGILDAWLISLADFMRWNTSIRAGCTNFKTQYSYCVEAASEPASDKPATTAVLTAAAPTTSQKTTVIMTSTAPSNRITTPSPIQDGMVTNCDGFYLVKSGDQCQSIADGNGITLTQFYAFNPAVGTQCESLWGGTYACIHILGTGPNAVTKSPPTTTAAASNRITTPKSIQPGIVGNCNSFYLVQPGEACAAIADKNSITLSQFYAWNTQVGTGCSSLWANAYACVGIIGYVKSTPTTSKGNGITTPTPIQTGMTTRCKKFHLVAGGETCDPIAKAAGISLQQFLNWNPAASSTCSALWANTYCCIAVL